MEDGTQVMTLGRSLGRGFGAAQISPRWGYNPMPGNRTATPQQPQNLPRPTLQNGPHAFGTLGNVVRLATLGRGLGDADAAVVEDAPQPPPAVGDPTSVPAGTTSPMYTEIRVGIEPSAQVTAWRRIGTAALYLSPVSAAASAYHGYKRNDGAIGWTVWWMVLGGLFPLVTPAIGLAQGWGKRKRG